MYCKKCGNQCDDNAKFCLNCGEPLLIIQKNGMQNPNKKTGLIIGIVVAVVLVLILFAVLIVGLLGKIIRNAGAFDITPPTISQAYIASDIDLVTAKAITKQDVFDEYTQIVYVSVRVNNAVDGTKAFATWEHLESGETIDSEILALNDSTTWIYFYLENPDGLFSGNYNVEILLDNEVEKTLGFSILGDREIDDYSDTFPIETNLIPEFTDAAIATEIDTITGEPLNDLYVISTLDTIVYATAFIEDAPVGTEIQAIWTHLPSGEVLEGEILSTVDPDCWVYYSLTNDDGLTAGEYEVDFFIDGEYIFFLDFIIE